MADLKVAIEVPPLPVTDLDLEDILNRLDRISVLCSEVDGEMESLKAIIASVPWVQVLSIAAFATAALNGRAHPGPWREQWIRADIADVDAWLDKSSTFYTEDDIVKHAEKRGRGE